MMRVSERSKTTSICSKQDSKAPTCSTLDHDVKGQFNRMKQTVHSLFQQARNELSVIYKTILNWVNETSEILKLQQNLDPKLTTQIAQLQMNAETAISQIHKKMLKCLKIPNFLHQYHRSCKNIGTVKNIDSCKNIGSWKQIGSSNSLNFYGHMPSNLSARRSDTSKPKIPSSSHQFIEGDSVFDGQPNHVIKIKSGQIRNLEDWKLINGEFPKLESIVLESKKFIEGVNLGGLKADNLQSVNFSKNNIISLHFLEGSHFPHLTQLNLSKNKIKKVTGLNKTIFPRLIILNLSANLIDNLESINKCNYPQLLELNLENNRLAHIDELITSQFSSLEILNLDRNCLENVECLAQCPFYRLKVLTFSHNDINSLHFISKVSWRRLQALIAHNNKIESLEGLALANLPKIREIVLHNNQIKNIEPIRRMVFPELTGFDLQFNDVQIQTIGCFAGVDKNIKQAKKIFPFILF